MAVVLLGLSGLAGSAGTAPALAGTPQFEQLVGEGLDSCAAPSLSQMSAFWSNTPYSAWGIYIGGEDRACSQPNLTASWVSSVTAQGWHLLPLWVGPQNPCVSGFDHFSTDTSTAYSQGETQAEEAYDAMVGLGMASNSPVIYDLEGGSGSTTACIDATKSFVEGWVTQLHVAPAQSAGVYTSACAGFLDQFSTIANPPDFVDGASWDGDPSTSDLPCVSSSHWVDHQRHKQYDGGHNVTYNGVTLNVDSDCSNGPSVALAPFNGNSACL
jgi:Domain of unknown function (DUF1906)